MYRREKKGIGMNNLSSDIERHPIPILDSQEIDQLTMSNVGNETENNL